METKKWLPRDEFLKQLRSTNKKKDKLVLTRNGNLIRKSKLNRFIKKKKAEKAEYLRSNPDVMSEIRRDQILTSRNIRSKFYRRW